MPSICGPFEFLPLPDCAQAGASKAQTANIPLSKRKIVIFTVVVSPSGELMILCEYVTRRLLTFFLPLGVEALFERSPEFEPYPSMKQVMVSTEKLRQNPARRAKDANCETWL
jgi:hypothetical protein